MWDAHELQETKRSWAAQQGEEAALRAALRAADANCPAPVQLAAAQAEMASLRLALLLHRLSESLQGAWSHTSLLLHPAFASIHLSRSADLDRSQFGAKDYTQCFV